MNSEVDPTGFRETFQLASAWLLLSNEYHLEVFEPIIYHWLCNAC